MQLARSRLHPPPDKRAVKGSWQQFTKAERFRLPIEVREHDFNVPAKLPKDLPAGPARRSQHLGIRDHRHSFKAPGTLRKGLEDSDAFRTDSEAVRRILDIAAAMNASVGILNGRSYFEL